MAKLDTSAYKTFDDITGRLDKIVADVRDKDTSLEHSLDLFDEAIALGSKAVDFVDTSKVLPSEVPEPIEGESTEGDDKESKQENQDKNGAQGNES